MKIISFERPGLVLARRWRGRITVTYREILTAERTARATRLRLHTRTTDPLDIACRRGERPTIEDELRARGVRIVDEYGAIIAPTLDDFQAELSRDPGLMRQSSECLRRIVREAIRS